MTLVFLDLLGGEIDEVGDGHATSFVGTGAEGIGQVFRQEQGEMAFRAVFGEFVIRESAFRINHGDALGSHLADQTSGALDL